MTKDFGYPYGEVEVPDSTKEILELSDCCPGCIGTETIQPGHSQCSFDTQNYIRQGYSRIAGPVLTSAGWKSLVQVDDEGEETLVTEYEYGDFVKA